MSSKNSLEAAWAQMSSPEFISRVRNRDVDVVEFLVRTYTEALYRAGLGLGFDSTASEELVQVVWVTFFEIAPSFEGRAHVRTFLFGILYNKAAEARRDGKRIEDGDPVDEAMNSRFALDGHWIRPPINPEQFMQSSQLMALIHKCIDALPLTQRMAFCLREIDDLESEEICNILDVTVTNLGVLLYRARNRLRECIDGKARTRKS